MKAIKKKENKKRSRKKENKNSTKKAQENKNWAKKATKKKRKKLFFFLDHFLGRVLVFLFSYILVFFRKFPPLSSSADL